MTALMIVSSLGSATVVELLLKIPSVDVNMQDDQVGGPIIQPTALVYITYECCSVNIPLSFGPLPTVTLRQ